MKKVIKNFSIFALVFGIAVFSCACSLGGKCEFAEKVELTSAVLSEVEFENADTVTLKQDCENVSIGGSIAAMSQAQKNAYGNSEVGHVVVLKLVFDKERTLDGFEIKGEQTKVFGNDSTVENYVGTLSSILDNESGEDAYVNLILSAATKNYELVAKYTDESTRKINISIEATLVEAAAE